MTPEQEAAYVNAQAACALIDMQGMVAENAAREHIGLSPIYRMEEFNALITRYGIHHNAVMGRFAT